MLVGGFDDGSDEIVVAVEGDLDEPGGGSDAGLVIAVGEAGSFVADLDGEIAHGGL